MTAFLPRDVGAACDRTNHALIERTYIEDTKGTKGTKS